jgi:hypothetical protein
MVMYFKVAAKLHYGLTQKEALKLDFQHGKKKNGGVTPESRVKNKCGGKMGLKRLRKMSQVLVFEKR